MKIATISLNISWQDIQSNLQKAESFILKAKNDGCDVVVFPEVFNTGFVANMDKYVEIPEGITYKTLQRLAIDNSISLVAGISEKTTNKKAKNVAIVFDSNGKELAKYVKIHPFNYANEGEHFVSGEKTVSFSLEKATCSVFICYDLRFPEIFRKVAKSSQVIFVVANWPDTREKHWQHLLVSRAIENQCFIVGVNRTGKDGVGLRYNGSSMIINPSGKVLMQTDNDTEYEFCILDLKDVSLTRERFPFLEDMRFV
jgi:predicted amidohydrolase